MAGIGCKTRIVLVAVASCGLLLCALIIISVYWQPRLSDLVHSMDPGTEYGLDKVQLSHRISAAATSGEIVELPVPGGPGFIRGQRFTPPNSNGFVRRGTSFRNSFPPDWGVPLRLGDLEGPP